MSFGKLGDAIVWKVIIIWVQVSFFVKLFHTLTALYTRDISPGVHYNIYTGVCIQANGSWTSEVLPRLMEFLRLCSGYVQFARSIYVAGKLKCDWRIECSSFLQTGKIHYISARNK